MDKRGRIRLSTMEIILLTALLGGLALDLLLTWRQESLQQRANAEIAEADAGEH